MDEVKVQIGAHLVNRAAAMESVGDLAWEHARFASEVLDMPFGSDEFVAVFEEMKAAYEGITDHLEFLTYTALVLVKQLLRDKMIALTCEFPISDAELAVYLGEVSESIVASYAWLFAGQNIMWPTNEELDDLSDIVEGFDPSVTFTFPADQIIITQ
jgi:hypothetical protein